MKERSPSDKQDSELDLENAIGILLRYGVIASSFVVAIGVLLSPLTFGSYTGTPSNLDQVFKTNYGATILSFGILFRQLVSLNPLSIIELGVIVLLAIPFFRVGAGGMMFLHERDWKYVMISFLVLAVLFIGTFVIGPYEISK